jgi:uncharacterized membrane protein (DUF441 family)
MKKKMKKLCAVFIACMTVLTLTIGVSANPTATLSSTITTTMLQGIFTEFMALVAIAVPVVVSFLAFKKGWRWVTGSIRKA